MISSVSSSSTAGFRSSSSVGKNPFDADSDAIRESARDTLRDINAYSPAPFGEETQRGWLSESFETDVRNVRSGSASSVVADSVSKFFAWRARCQTHEARELAKLEHLLRCWEYFERAGDGSIHAYMTAFFRMAWGLPFMSKPTWAALDRLGRRRVQQLSPLTPSLRMLGREREATR